MIGSLRTKFNKFSKNNKFLTAGVPFLALVIGSTLFLSNFMETHMSLKDKQNSSKTQRKFDLDEEHAKIMKQLDIENFKLSRIPRPGEDTKNMGSDRYD